MMAALALGSIDAGDLSIKRLLERIVEFESTALQNRVRQLQRDASLMPADSGLDDIVIILRRFSQDCMKLLFFRRLGFMPVEHVVSLNAAVCSRVEGVFDDLARHLQREAGTAVDEGVFLIERLRLQWIEGGLIEQLR